MDTAAEISQMIEKSRELERSGEIAGSLRLATQARELAQAQSNADLEAFALNVITYAHIRLGHYEQAKQYCQKVLELAGDESPARVDALLNLGICAGETDNLDTLYTFTQQAVDLSHQIGYDRALVRGLHSLACTVYVPRGQFDLALTVDAEALHIAQMRGLAELTWGPLTTMSYAHWLQGQPALALVRLEELQQVMLPGSLAEGYWYYIRANLALEHGNIEQAKNYFTHTLSLAEANGIVENLFIARIGMSRLNRTLNHAPAAKSWAQEALAGAEKSGYQHFQAQAYIEQARADWLLGDLPAAEADLRAAIALLQPQRLEFDLARAELLLAAFLHQQHLPEARALWQETVARIVQNGFAFLVDKEQSLAYPLIDAGLKSATPSVIEASNNLLEYLQKAQPLPLNINTLGGWGIQCGERLISDATLKTRRAGELLGLLLIAPGHSLSHEQICESLWPNKTKGSSQALLHQATSTLRRAIEPDLPERFPSRYLRVEEGRIALVLPTDSEVDFEVFENLITQAKWESALAIYHGDFLPEYRYAEWCTAQREWLRQDYQTALLAMARQWIAEGRFRGSLDACRKVLAIEPWQEEAVLIGMQALVGLGNITSALRLYQTLEKSLREDLGVEPQAELQAYYQALLNK